MANGTDNTYSPAVQQTLGGTPGQPGWVGQGLGFSQADIAALQQAGISVSDLRNMQLLGGPTTTSPVYTPGGGAGTQQPTTAYSGGQQQQAALLRAMLKIGGGGQQQQQAPPPGNYYGSQYPLYAMDAQGNPTGKPIYANPTNQASLLGAAALQMPAVINPPPSGTPSAKSGVAPTGGALIGTSTPQVAPNWDMIAHQAGLSSSDVSKLIAQGMTPTQAAQKYNVAGGGLAGPWSNPQIGSVFTPVARTAPTMALGATPLQAAGQPTATGYSPTATPFAQPPPAPGLQIPQSPLIAAHTDALADAGKALFAHFGGDPNSASPANIMQFHNQLTEHLAAAPQPTAAKVPAFGSAYGTPPPITLPPWQGGQAGTGTAVAGQGGLPPANIIGTTPSGPIPPPNPQAVAGLPGNLPGISGGPPVFGSAYGTPPPITLPPWQGTKKMQSGGRVPGRGNEDTVPALLTPGEYVIPKPQVQQLMRTGRLPIKMAGGGTVEDPDPDPSAPPEARRKTLSTAAQSSSAPAAPAAPTTPTVPTGSHLASGLATAAQTYANRIGGGIPAGSTAGAGAYGTVGSLMAGQGSAGAAGSLGQLPAGGGMQSALGGIGSGLSQAAQAIASSVKPWQMQQSAIPAPPPAPAAPQFTQQQIPQQRQGSGSPYIAYATYPATPYGT